MKNKFLYVISWGAVWERGTYHETRREAITEFMKHHNDYIGNTQWEEMVKRGYKVKKYQLIEVKRKKNNGRTT